MIMRGGLILLSLTFVACTWVISSVGYGGIIMTVDPDAKMLWFTGSDSGVENGEFNFGWESNSLTGYNVGDEDLYFVLAIETPGGVSGDFAANLFYYSSGRLAVVIYDRPRHQTWTLTGLGDSFKVDYSDQDYGAQSAIENAAYMNSTFAFFRFAGANGTGGSGLTVQLSDSGGGGQVPEPTSIAIFGLGALGLAYRARRKAKS